MIWAWRLLFAALLAVGTAIIGFCVLVSVVTLSQKTIDVACVAMVASLLLIAGCAHVVEWWDQQEYRR